MPRGIPNKVQNVSEQTQRLIDTLQELEARLAAERRKDKARAMLVNFALKHDLIAADLREAARLLSAREKGDAPAQSKNFSAAKAGQMGKAIKQAREAKGLSNSELVRRIGAKGTGAVSAWENGMVPRSPKYRAALIKHLDLPKDFFADLPPSSGVGQAPKPKGPRANGAASAH